MKVSKTINWSEVWKKFDTWFTKEETRLYDSCNHNFYTPKWEDQQAKIQELVAKQLGD